MRTRLLFGLLLLLNLPVLAAADWDAALGRMPLHSTERVLNHTNCAQVVLHSFQSNDTVKAVIFMPGATDELYFFHRVAVTLTNHEPSLLDALIALTNQSPVQVSFHSPFLLLHTPEDFLDLRISIQHQGTLEKLKSGRPLPHVLALDRDWTSLLGLIKKQIPATLLPYEQTRGSWHFYRHTFSGWNLTPWETLQAAAFAGKTQITVQRKRVVFEIDPRVGEPPKLEKFPGH